MVITYLFKKERNKMMQRVVTGQKKMTQNYTYVVSENEKEEIERNLAARF